MKIIVNNEKLPKMKKINVTHEMEIFKILFPMPFLKILTKWKKSVLLVAILLYIFSNIDIYYFSLFLSKVVDIQPILDDINCLNLGLCPLGSLVCLEHFIRKNTGIVCNYSL